MKRGMSYIMAAMIVLSALVTINCSNNSQGSNKAPGIVDGDIITLKAVVGGTLEKLDLTEGQPVAKDNLVAHIDSDKLINQLQELDIRLKEIDVSDSKIKKQMVFLNKNIDYLDKQVKRFQRLKEKKAVPGEKYEALEIKLLEAQTSRFDLSKSLEELELQKEKINNKRELLNLQLDDHNIEVPVDGVVIETFVKQGETVFPGTAIADVLDRNSLYVEIFIEETEMGQLKMNQKVGIQVDGLSEETVLSGQIYYFGKKAEFSPKYIISETERKSLLYQVKIRIDDPNGILKIGMPVTVLLKNND